MSRCARPPQVQPEGDKHRSGAAAERRGLSAASNALRILGQVLDEIDLLGGGKVVVVTNEPAVVDLLLVRLLLRDCSRFFCWLHHRRECLYNGIDQRSLGACVLERTLVVCVAVLALLVTVFQNSLWYVLYSMGSAIWLLVFNISVCCVAARVLYHNTNEHVSLLAVRIRMYFGTNLPP